ncbi:MAG: DUF523 domain-containing protein, partial [Planctomycetota bacterium]
VRCRYDGNSNEIPDLCEKADDNDIITICPEQMGRLPTPREPVSLCGGYGEAVLDGKARVMTLSGKDVTTAALTRAGLPVMSDKTMDT